MRSAWLRTRPHGSEQVFETNLSAMQGIRTTVNTMTKTDFPLGPLTDFFAELR